MFCAGLDFAFDVKAGEKEAFALLDHLQIMKLVVSLGCTETLISHSASMTHSGSRANCARRLDCRMCLSAEQQGPKLIEIAQRFNALVATSLTNPGDTPKIVGLENDARTAIEAGDLASADELLAQIEAEQRQSLQRQTAAYAATLAQRGEVALARLRYREAAGHFANAAAVLPQTDEYRDARFNYLSHDANALYQQGDENGDNASLLLGIERYQSLLRRKPRDRVPLDWATTQNNLGTALQTLGGRESGTARLEQAVAAYRAALEERTRERVPLHWATTQNNFGNALSKLGGRESGTARLEQAVAAYRASLEERTRERVPLQWAMTQTNLGNALATLGERESSAARLEEAVQSYRLALEESHPRTRSTRLGDDANQPRQRAPGVGRAGERDGAAGGGRSGLSLGSREGRRDRVPLDWATTQNNLGTALAKLGEREARIARLEEAVQAHRTALEEHTRERVPLAWAATQTKLGNALSRLGKRENDTARLEEAVIAYRSALNEYTRERFPLKWAGSQMNLGNALASLGERESGPARLEQAVAACNAALEECTREQVPLQ
jgi:tetratricopeptide (TPR) repeat protein